MPIRAGGGGGGRSPPATRRNDGKPAQGRADSDSRRPGQGGGRAGGVSGSLKMNLCELSLDRVSLDYETNLICRVTQVRISSMN